MTSRAKEADNCALTSKTLVHTRFGSEVAMEKEENIHEAPHSPAPKSAPPERTNPVSSRGPRLESNVSVSSPFTDRIPVEKLRPIWDDQNRTYSCEELLAIRDWLYDMAEIIIEVINAPSYRAPADAEREIHRLTQANPRSRSNTDTPPKPHSHPPV